MRGCFVFASKPTIRDHDRRGLPHDLRALSDHRGHHRVQRDLRDLRHVHGRARDRDLRQRGHGLVELQN